MGKHRLNKYYNYNNQFIIYVFKWRSKGHYYCKILKDYNNEISMWEKGEYSYFEDWSKRLVKELTKDKVMAEMI